MNIRIVQINIKKSLSSANLFSYETVVQNLIFFEFLLVQHLISNKYVEKYKNKFPHHFPFNGNDFTSQSRYDTI